ncbi:MAG: YceI family protein [Myxococcota bacterium]
MLALAVATSAFAVDTLSFTEADGRIGFTAEGSLGAFEGRATDFGGAISPATGAGELIVPAGALTTGLGPRDSRMLRWCLEAERFPEIRFTLTGGPLGEGGGAVLKGRLTVRDVTRDVEIPATFSWEGPNLRLQGRYEMDLRDWNVPDPAVVLATMDPTFAVTFDVVARPS